MERFLKNSLSIALYINDKIGPIIVILVLSLHFIVGFIVIISRNSTLPLIFSILFSLSIFTLISCGIPFLFYKMLKLTNIEYRFYTATRLILKWVIILFIFYVLIRPSKEAFDLGVYDAFRICIPLSFLKFSYDELRRNYLIRTYLLDLQAPKKVLFILTKDWKSMLWLIVFSLIIFFINPFSILIGTSKKLWIIIDIMICLITFLAFLRDLKLGNYLRSRYLIFTDNKENYDEHVFRQKIFICEEYYVSFAPIPYDYYAKNSQKSNLIWSEWELEYLFLPSSF